MVHPYHGLSHLVRRQRNQQNNNDDDDEVTVLVTMANTFTGDVVWVTQSADSPKSTLVAPVQKTRASSDSKPTTTSRRTSAAAKETKSESTAKATATAKTSSSDASGKTSSSLLVATASPTDPSTRAALATATSSLAAAGVSASASSSAEAATSSGMSGGAKAGLVLGVLVVTALFLGGILFLCHRKKKNNAQNKVDDEKSAMRNAPPPPPPQVATQPNTPTSTAPRLSLRPASQFDSAFVGAAAGAAAKGRSPSPVRPRSPWERLGASNASTAPPVNPFNDPQPRSSIPQNPFGNNAAIELQNSAPSTPTIANHSLPPTPGLVIPAVALASADATVLDTPTIQNAFEKSPLSPAWTDDIPASPGPAPSGPLPIASGQPASGPAPGPNNVHRIQLDFVPSMPDELELRAGQLVRMLHEYDDGWALCLRMDRSKQGVVPRTCISKHPVKPRAGAGSRQGPPGHRGVPQPRPLSPASGRNSPHPPALSPANGRMSPGPRSMSPVPLQTTSQERVRSNSNAPYAGPPRSMSPGPYGGGPQAAPSEMGRARSNSASQAAGRRPPPGPSPMNPNADTPLPRKPLPGQAL